MSNELGKTTPADIDQAKGQMRQGDFAGASALLESILAAAPDDIEALYCLAVCARKLNFHEKAFALSDRLVEKAPSYDRAFQERGFLLQARGEEHQAVAAFDKAIQLNPALHASWRVLSQSDGYFRQDEAKHHYARLSALPPELVAVSSLMYQNKLHKAEKLCRHFLNAHPKHVEAMRLLAELGVKFQILDDAEFLLESCLEFEPDFLHARHDYVAVLHKRQKFTKALEQAKILYDTDPDNPAFGAGLGSSYQAVGDFEAAIACFDNVLAKDPGSYGTHLSRGHALKTIGRMDEAVKAYHASYAQKTDFGEAYWSLANLKTYRFSDEELADMRALEASENLSDEDRIHLSFAIGKALEDRKDYALSFQYYAAGNALKAENAGYQRERVAAELDYQKRHFNAAFFTERAGHGHAAPDPIFIVGLPRAGSTLLEQILASHSQVDGTMELANIISTAHQFNGRRAAQDEPLYPAILNDLSAGDLRTLGEKYISETREHRHGAAFFIDKMPNNFRHIALIHLILPNAKIIDARREAMACCFSGFKQLFAEGQEFSYAQENIADYYQQYIAVMDHWESILPGRILRVQHEDVIADLETQVRRILDYCGLEFEQACIDFHQTKRAIRTPSSEQVRQPINRSGMEQWRNYEAFLGPLKTTLGKK